MEILQYILHKFHMLGVIIWYWFCNRMANAYLRRCRAYVGKNVVFKGRARLQVYSGAQIAIGNNFVCHSDAYSGIDNSSCSKIVVHENARLEIGNNSGMTNTVIQCLQSIKIGSFVNIGAGTMIFDSNFHSSNWSDRRSADSDRAHVKSAPICIGDDVFIGARTIICKGVSIGERSMIAAGSVVVNDIPSECIAGGNPCKVIRLIEK